MKKHRTVRLRLLLLVIIFIIGLSLSFFGYLYLENKEEYINQQISTTLKGERLIESIEKNVYQDALLSTDTFYTILDDIMNLSDIYKEKYIVQFPELMSSELTLKDYGIEMDKLLEKSESRDLLSYDYERLLFLNDSIKTQLIDSIVEHGQLSEKIFQAMIVGISLLLLLLTYMIYREIVTPLRQVTKALNEQHHHLIMNEIGPLKIHNEIGMLVEEYNELVRRNNLMLALNEKINAQQRFDEVFEFIYEALHDFIPYDRIGIAVISQNGKSIEALIADSKFKIKLGTGYNQLLERSSLKDVIQNHEIRIINDLEIYYRAHPFSDSTRLILEEGMRSSMTLPLFHDDKAIGVIFFSSTKKHVYGEEHQQFLVNIANALSTSLEKSFIFENLMISTVRGFAKIVESKDNITGNHIDRISHYSGFVAELLKDDFEDVDEKFIRSIRRLSPLHDIGKVAIPDHILNKPARLSSEEMAIMKTHSMYGAEILDELLVSIGTSEFKMAVDIAKFHHEKVNGNGYPLGLKGSNIPLAARIVALVDVFDALTSERPYKKAFTFKEAIEIIQKDSGMHFDSIIVSRVMEHLSEFEALYKKLWAT